MARVALAVHSLVEGDAVSHDFLGMHEALRACGHQVSLFARDWHGRLPKVQWFSHIGRLLQDPKSVFIYHHAMGWDGGVEAVNRARCKRIIRYHNVTPPEFFERYHHQFVQVCRNGRAQLDGLASANCDLYLSDSEYNRRELTDLGAVEERSAVVPPFHTISRMEGVEADQEVVHSVQDGKTNLLMVGRVAPNKGHLALVKAFATYHHEYNPNSRLVIVGKEDRRLGIYRKALRHQVEELGIQKAVLITGGVSEAALKAYYQTASVFVIASEHEGFCVPLVEAMALKLPVVALGSSAIPETLGEAGLIWEEADPYLFAESIHILVNDEESRKALGELGADRYRKHFSSERIRDRFLEAVNNVI